MYYTKPGFAADGTDADPATWLPGRARLVGLVVAGCLAAGLVAGLSNLPGALLIALLSGLTAVCVAGAGAVNLALRHWPILLATPAGLLLLAPLVLLAAEGRLPLAGVVTFTVGAALTAVTQWWAYRAGLRRRRRSGGR